MKKNEREMKKKSQEMKTNRIERAIPFLFIFFSFLFHFVFRFFFLLIFYFISISFLFADSCHPVFFSGLLGHSAGAPVGPPGNALQSQEQLTILRRGKISHYKQLGLNDRLELEANEVPPSRERVSSEDTRGARNQRKRENEKRARHFTGNTESVGAFVGAFAGQAPDALRGELEEKERKATLFGSGAGGSGSQREKNQQAISTAVVVASDAVVESSA